MFKFEVDQDINLVFLHQAMAEDLYALVDANREYLGEWLPWVSETNSPDDTRLFIEQSIVSYSKGEESSCAIEYKGQIAGTIAYVKISELRKAVELGYWLSPHLQGYGIITRSCNSLIQYAFTEMKMQKVQTRVATENLASRKVCERLGCSLEGIITNAENINGRIVDMAMYGLHAKR